MIDAAMDCPEEDPKRLTDKQRTMPPELTMSKPPDDKSNVTNELLPLIYEELRGVARRFFREQRPDFTLCPTELVNEACVHLLRYAPGPWDSPEHFRAIATHKIWQVVVDHLKRRGTIKRGGRRIGHGDAAKKSDDAAYGERTSDEDAPAPPLAGDAGVKAETPPRSTSPKSAERWSRIPLEVVQVEWHDRRVELLDLAEALEALQAQHGRPAEVVMLHWFGGLKYPDAARLLGVSVSTAEKDFRFALAWLNRRLAGNT